MVPTSTFSDISVEKLSRESAWIKTEADYWQCNTIDIRTYVAIAITIQIKIIIQSLNYSYVAVMVTTTYL